MCFSTCILATGGGAKALYYHVRTIGVDIHYFGERRRWVRFPEVWGMHMSRRIRILSYARNDAAAAGSHVIGHAIRVDCAT